MYVGNFAVLFITKYLWPAKTAEYVNAYRSVWEVLLLFFVQVPWSKSWFHLRLTAAFQLSSGPLGLAPLTHVVPSDWTPPTDIKENHTNWNYRVDVHDFPKLLNRQNNRQNHPESFLLEGSTWVLLPPVIYYLRQHYHIQCWFAFDSKSLFKPKWCSISVSFTSKNDVAHFIY